MQATSHPLQFPRIVYAIHNICSSSPHIFEIFPSFFATFLVFNFFLFNACYIPLCSLLVFLAIFCIVQLYILLFWHSIFTSFFKCTYLRPATVHSLSVSLRLPASSPPPQKKNSLEKVLILRGPECVAALIPPSSYLLTVRVVGGWGGGGGGRIERFKM